MIKKLSRLVLPLALTIAFVSFPLSTLEASSPKHPSKIPSVQRDPSIILPQWTAETSSGQRNWQAITSSSDGTKLAAVVQGGYIYTSTDSGVTWTEQTGSGSRIWTGISSSSDGTKLVASAFGQLDWPYTLTEYAYRSVDSGVTWNPLTNLGQGNWDAIASAGDGTKLAVSNINEHILTSVDSGATWTYFGDDANYGSSLTYSTDGTTIAGGDAENVNFIAVSTDSGDTWNRHIVPRGGQWSSIASSADGTKLVAGSNDHDEDHDFGVYTSTDSGTTWTPTSVLAKQGYLASSANGDIIALATYNGYIYTSSNGGSTWIEEVGSGQRQWKGIASSADGTKFIAITEGGYIYHNNTAPLIFTSEQDGAWNIGTTWGSACAADCVEGTDYPESTSDVIISNTVSLTDDISIKNLNINEGGDLVGGSHNLSLSGDLYNVGTLTTSGTLDVDGSTSNGGTITADGIQLPRTFITVVTGNDSFYNDQQKIIAVGADGFVRFIYWTNEESDLHFVQCTDLECDTKNDTLVASTDPGNMDSILLLMGHDDLPRIVYAAEYDTLNYIQCTNADCSSKTDNLIDNAGQYYENGFALDANDLPSIVYNGYPTGWGTPVDLKLAQCSDAACSSPVITSLATYSGGNVGGVSIKIGKDTFPRIIYSDNDAEELHYIQCTNLSCSAKNDTVVEGGIGSYYKDLVLGSDGFARIVYADYNDTAEKFVQCTNASCSTSNITTLTSSTNNQNSIVLGHDGFPRITYSTSNAVYYVKCGNASCLSQNTELVSSPSDYENSIALGLDGFPRILYQSYDDSTIYLAYPEGTVTVSAPSITINEATNIHSNSATLNANITDAGGTEVAERGFEYGKTESYGTTISKTGAFSAGSFSEEIQDLSCNHTYHYRAFATNPADTTYSDDATFDTHGCVSTGSGSSSGPSRVSTPVIIPPASTDTTQTNTNSNTNVTNTNTVASNLGPVTLRQGSTGTPVINLQTFLNNILHTTLVTDGKLGPKTIAAIKQYQLAHGLVPDGIVGPKTKASMAGGN